jgi:hypothetical protein
MNVFKPVLVLPCIQIMAQTQRVCFNMQMLPCMLPSVWARGRVFLLEQVLISMILGILKNPKKDKFLSRYLSTE